MLALAIAAVCSPWARADEPPRLGDSHLVYGTACGLSGGLRVVIDAMPGGSKVTVTRSGAYPGPFETRDVNFAHVSRRLFFKAKTGSGLIEFQGHARGDALAGMLSDESGKTREIRLPSTRPRPDACVGDKR